MMYVLYGSGGRVYTLAMERKKGFQSSAATAFWDGDSGDRLLSEKKEEEKGRNAAITFGFQSDLKREMASSISFDALFINSFVFNFCEANCDQ